MGSIAEQPAAPTKYHLYVYGKHHDPKFQMYKVAADFLAREKKNVEATVEGLFEAQFEQKLKQVIGSYGGPFTQSKSSQPIIFAETQDEVLYFLNDKRFFDWALKRFQYEDHTRLIFYKRIASKALQAAKQATGRSYCAFAVSVGGDPQELVQLELFDEETPILARNFLDLLANPKFDGHKLHRVKAGAFVQAGDIVDGSGLNSTAAGGEFLRHESFQIQHDRPGLLGMANHGKDTNGSQFYITLRELPFLDGKSVIFGRVTAGFRTLLKISKLATRNERPVVDVKVYAQPDYTVVGEVQKSVDQGMDKAAVKLQAMQRGKKDRQKVEELKTKK
jgi:cyclophilin family peptidyl-prolyl cis-trans isomerase